MTTDELIFNCKFTFKCPELWDELQTTENPDVRYCELCQYTVRFIRKSEDFDDYLREEKCFAVNMLDPQTGGSIAVVGAIAPPYEENQAIVNIYIQPIDTLSAPQLKLIKETIKTDMNFLQIRKAFCDGKEHILIQEICSNEVEEISARLMDNAIPFAIKEA
jgi:hypothetical protein